MDVDEWPARCPNRDDERMPRDEQDPFFAHPEASCIDLEYPVPTTKPVVIETIEFVTLYLYPVRTMFTLLFSLLIP